MEGLMSRDQSFIGSHGRIRDFVCSQCHRKRSSVFPSIPMGTDVCITDSMRDNGVFIQDDTYFVGSIFVGICLNMLAVMPRWYTVSVLERIPEFMTDHFICYLYRR